MEPEYETEGGHDGPTPALGAGQAWPRLGVVWPPRCGLAASATPSTYPSHYKKPLTRKYRGVRRFSRKSSAALLPPETPIRD